MKIDLHIHSCFSDGAFTPTDLVARAVQLGVGVIAIADHDSVAGVGEGIAAGRDHGIEVLSAVELSVQLDDYKDVHLLGYGIDSEDVAFRQRLNGFRNRREQRNDEILVRVNQALEGEGLLPLEQEEVRRFTRDVIGRPHIARALLERRYVRTVEEAFQRYLVPCNVPKTYWPIGDAIEEIHRIGGAAVLAHPTSVTRDLQELRSLIVRCLEFGLDGIEVFNNMAWPDEMEQLRRLAEELGLLATAGSDFHGLEDGQEIGCGRSGIRFGQHLMPPLIDRIASRRAPH
ncbi:MAG: PHP domain-containing protein [Desulfuromonadales bacterium]